MTIVVVSIHALNTALGSKTRILAILRHLRSHFGSCKVMWINVLPSSLSGLVNYREFKREASAIHESTKIIPLVRIPFVNPLVWKCYSFGIFLYMLARFGRGKTIVILAEMTLSAWPFMMYKNIFSVPLIVDAHGTNDEYIQFTAPTARILRRYAQAVVREGIILSKAQGIIAVSKRLLDLFQSRFGFLPPEHVVIPTLPDSSCLLWNEKRRRSIRKELDFKGRFVFVYSGSTYPWQCIDEMLLFFDRVRNAKQFAGLNVLFLMLTWDRSFSVKEKCDALGISDGAIVERKLSQAEVSHVLQSADVGMLFRRNVTTNLVASPTKAAEYLLSGLPILCTPYVGDISEAVVRMDAGFSIQMDCPDLASISRWCHSVKQHRKKHANLAVRCGMESFEPSSMNRLSEIVEKVGAEKGRRE